MSKVSPVCVENALRAVLMRILAHFQNIAVSILCQIHPLVPAAHPRTQVLNRTCLRHRMTGIHRRIGRIPPCQAQCILRQLGNQFWSAADNIPKKLYPFSAAVQELTQRLYMVDLHLLFANPLCRLTGLFTAKVKGLVRTDVELF